MAASHYRRYDVVRTLIQAGADISLRCDKGWSAMTIAAIQARGLDLSESPDFTSARPDRRLLDMLTEKR